MIRLQVLPNSIIYQRISQTIPLFHTEYSTPVISYSNAAKTVSDFFQQCHCENETDDALKKS